MLHGTESIQSLLIPIRDDHLVLPNAAVAEVVFFSAIEPMENTPSWLLGMLAWRNLSVLVVSIEAAINEDIPPPSHHKQKYAVLKALGNDPSFRFFAIRTEGIPQLVRIDKSTISPVPDEMEATPFVLKHVFVNEKTAMIPNLDNIEDKVKEVLRAVV